MLEPEYGRSGEVVLTVACMKDISSKPIDRRQLLVHISENGQLEISEGR